MTSLILAIAVATLGEGSAVESLTVPDSFAVPQVEPGEPVAGRRVAVTPREYAGTQVRHTIYLPIRWQQPSDDENRWPVVVEYTGNRFPTSGSTGEVEDAALGYGMGQENAIWVVLPIVSADGQSNETRWWGDAKATVDYALTNVPRICEQFGGDPERVILCGFSRGAIGVNYIGLHNDCIAKLWAGFVTHDHYDGVRHWRQTSWGSPFAVYQRQATARLQRVGDRPVLACQNGSTDDIRAFLEPRHPLANVTFLDVPVVDILGDFPNAVAVHPHTDRWLLVPSEQRDVVTRWFDSVVNPLREPTDGIKTMPSE